MAINSLSSASKGFSGLVSGMDTQSMVDSMLAGTQAKIDKQKANKTILEYKRESYRDILTSFKAFQNNYFKFGSKSGNNLLSSGFYNSMTAATDSKALRATAGTTANAGKVTINRIEQLAQSLQYESKHKASGEVQGTLDLDAFNSLEQQAQIQLQLDGVTKTIKLPIKTGTALTATDVKEQLQASIIRAFGNGITVSVDGNAISFAATDASREFIIGGTKDAMNLLGMTSGVSNKINTGLSLENINFKTSLQGSEYAFAINGISFAFHQGETLGSIINQINASDAGVKIRYSELTDKFSIESTVSGAGTSIEMTQQSGNLLTAMFGIQGSSGISGKALYETVDIVGDVAPNSALDTEINRYVKSGGAFELLVGDKKVSVTLPKPGESDPALTHDDVIAAINAQLAEDGLVSLSKDAEGKVSIVTAQPNVKVETAGGFALLGFNTAKTNTQLAKEQSSLEKLGLNGTSITIGASSVTIGEAGAPATVEELVTHLNAAMGTDGVDSGAKFDESKGKIVIFGVSVPMEILIGGDGNQLFGTDAIKLEPTKTAGMEADMDVTQGKNAVLYINGQRVERSSNQFTVEGISYELLEETDTAQTINITRDTDKVLTGIEKFVEEYNALVDKIWGLLKEDAVYKDYAPLTDAQKKEMSEKEVELWEKKSKEGLLRGDDTLELIMDSLRSVLNTKPAGAKYSLYDIGITTGYDIEKGFGGMLKFTDSADPGAKLRELLATDPQEVEKLFADSTSGVAVSLNKVLDNVTRYYEPGHESARYSLASLAGTNGLPDTSSKIYTEIRAIEKNLENLSIKYESEYNRYWKQFNAMEKLIQSMNQQSSWLTSQFS